MARCSQGLWSPLTYLTFTAKWPSAPMPVDLAESCMHPLSRRGLLVGNCRLPADGTMSLAATAKPRGCAFGLFLIHGM